MVTFFKTHWQIIVIATLAIMSSYVWWQVFTFRSHDLRFVMLDVGEGESFFIESPAGVRVLVNAGPGNAVLSALSDLVPFWDKRIDLAINTDPSLQNYEGFIPLLEHYRVDMFMQSSVATSSSALWHSLQSNLVEKNIKEITAVRGQVIDLGGGVTLTILFPDRDVSKLAVGDTSIVMRLQYGKTTMLITGDSTIKIENYLREYDSGNNLSANILQIPDAGSKTSLSADFLKAVSPDVALISVAENNPYHLPNQTTLDTLNTAHVPYLETGNEESIEYDSDGDVWVRRK